jgi:hypothetical protein
LVEDYLHLEDKMAVPAVTPRLDAQGEDDQAIEPAKVDEVAGTVDDDAGAIAHEAEHRSDIRSDIAAGGVEQKACPELWRRPPWNWRRAPQNRWRVWLKRPLPNASTLEGVTENTMAAP